MNRDEARVGARVTWADDEDDEAGTIIEVPAHRLAEMKTWTPSFQAEIERCVFVRWDEPHAHSTWTAWADLRLLPDDGAT